MKSKIFFITVMFISLIFFDLIWFFPLSVIALLVLHYRGKKLHGKGSTNDLSMKRTQHKKTE